MHDTMEKIQKICELQRKTICWMESHADEMNVQDIPLAGQVVDQIKDLCQAEKDLYKAKYYCTVTEAMEGYDDDVRMGYDHWRTSSGRYAPKGTGHWTPIRGRSGYPMPAEGDWRPEFSPWGDMDTYDQMMGYDNRGRGNRSQGGPDGRTSQGGNRMGYNDPDWEEYMQDEKHGTPYKQWKLARKHYTETKADGDKREMTEHAKEHMADTVMTLKEMWMAADPDLRTKMKSDLTALINDMK